MSVNQKSCHVSYPHATLATNENCYVNSRCISLICPRAKHLSSKTRPLYSLGARLENKTVFSLLLAQPGFNPLISEPTEPLLFFSL